MNLSHLLVIDCLVRSVIQGPHCHNIFMVLFSSKKLKENKSKRKWKWWKRVCVREPLTKHWKLYLKLKVSQLQYKVGEMNRQTLYLVLDMNYREKVIYASRPPPMKGNQSQTRPKWRKFPRNSILLSKQLWTATNILKVSKENRQRSGFKICLMYRVYFSKCIYVNRLWLCDYVPGGFFFCTVQTERHVFHKWKTKRYLSTAPNCRPCCLNTLTQRHN